MPTAVRNQFAPARHDRRSRGTPLRRGWKTPLLPFFPDDDLARENLRNPEDRLTVTAVQAAPVDTAATDPPVSLSLPSPPLSIVPAPGASDSTSQAKQALVEQLAREVRRLETSRRIGPADALQSGMPFMLPTGPVFSSGCRELDDCLPHGGYEAGTIIEYVQTGTAGGALYLALSAAKSALSATDRFGVVVDAQRQFYPPAAAAMGIDLKRLVVVRPQSLSDRLWALDQALRCTGVAVVIGEAEQLDDRSARRLQLAAERGGGLGLMIRGRSACSRPSWAEVQWRVRPLSKPAPHLPAQPAGAVSGSLLAGRQLLPQHDDRELELELMRVRGGEAGARVAIAIRAVDGSLQAASSRTSAAAARTDAHRATAVLAARLSQTNRSASAQPQHRTA